MKPDSQPHEAPWSVAVRAAASDRLGAGLEALGLDLDRDRHECLLDYLVLMSRWNRAYNLTRVEAPLEMVSRHLIDSLALAPWLTGERIVDAGTGAGLPGVPLAVAFPQRRFILVDSSGKKIRFLNQVRRSLGLYNIEPVQARLETLELDPPPDEIVARALAPLPRLVDWTARWLDGGARLLAMKGRLQADEQSAVGDAYNVRVHDLNESGQDGARCLVIIDRKSGEPA